MKEIYTFSIGISAYNEENSIKNLLQDLLSQNNAKNIKEIIVINDASEDKTSQIVNSFHSNKIILIEGKQRKGKTYRINELLRTFSGDILCLCDADIRIHDKNLFQNLEKDFKKSSYSLASLVLEPENTTNNFSKILAFRDSMKSYIKMIWNKGDNYLSFAGAFLLLDKNFAKEITLPAQLVNDDAYLYFKAKSMGLSTKYIVDQSVSYSVPTSWKDHINQSSRFTSSYAELQGLFKQNLKKDYVIPVQVTKMSLMKYFTKNPLLFTEYIGLLILTRIFKKRVNYLWNSANSTKGIL